LPTPKRPAAPAILVGVDLGLPHFDAELAELGRAGPDRRHGAGGPHHGKRKAPDAALFVGKGKADEIKALAEEHGATEVLFDQSLSPAQQRNLERHLGLPVNDRTLLILEIFAQRARSHEGKLQVELARLQYLSTRLVRRWSHLERQTGGAGVRGGPGEKQIELDRRMIGESIKRTRERLAKVKKQRSTQRRQRERQGAFNISLVGYTNAGKSTLFNALVKARAYAADQLFATLDTTTRQLYLGDAEAAGRSVSLSDTVGFIRDLPHGLIDAFQATLQEAADADLLLHVVDAPTRTFPSRSRKCSGCCARSAPPRCRSCWCSTRSTRSSRRSSRASAATDFEVEGVQVPRSSSAAAPARACRSCAANWRAWRPPAAPRHPGRAVPELT
jgi:GTP-binding protein HflX